MKKVVVTVYCLVLILALALCVHTLAAQEQGFDRTFSDEIVTESI